MQSGQEDLAGSEGLGSVPAFGICVSKSEQPHTSEDAIILDQENNLYAVFDGAGGVKGGRKAARDAARSFYNAAHTITGKRDLYDVARNAGASISVDDEAGITTASVVKVVDYFPDRRGFHVAVLNVGDSRVYRWRAAHKDLVQLTVDEGKILDKYDGDPVMVAKRSRRMSEIFDQSDLDEASTGTVAEFHERNKIFNGLGIGTSLEVNEANLKDWFIPEGDMLLITSDGITDNLGEGDEVPDRYRLSSIVNEAVKNGRIDNLPGMLANAAIDIQRGGRNRIERGVRSIAQGKKIVRSKRDDMSAIIVNLTSSKGTETPLVLPPSNVRDREVVSGSGNNTPKSPPPTSYTNIDIMREVPAANVRRLYEGAIRSSDPTVLKDFRRRYPSFRP